jgi:CheY-like chemotaxis protein
LPRFDAGEKDEARMSKILLVDDSKFLRLATERALARAGYDVCTATDGELALALAREKKPDVILLDMLLPKMTGPDVLKALKKDPETAGIAVVVFTGLSQKKRGSSAAGWSVRLSGKIGTGSGQRVRFVSGSAGGDREETQPAGSGARKVTDCRVPGYYFRSA